MSPRLVLGALLLIVAAAGCQGANPHQIVGAVMGTGPGGSNIFSDLRGATVDIDEPEEVELGRSFTAAVGGRYKVSRDAGLTKYVALVGNEVAAMSDRPDLRYYFAVLDTPEINAFAAPGGFIFVSRGALELMSDEAELAGVLGHEVGHVALKHHGEAIKDQKRKAVLARGAQIAGASFSQSAPFVGLIGVMVDGVIEQTLIKGFSRNEEMASDKVGFQYAARAGYEPAGLRGFLAALKAKSADAGVVKFNSTHPGLDDRLQEQAKLRDEYKGTGKRETLRFAQAMGRVQAPPQPQVQPQPQPQQEQQPQQQRQQPQRQQPRRVPLQHR
jgi:predicted Zn-dependent protease